VQSERKRRWSGWALGALAGILSLVVLAPPVAAAAPDPLPGLAGWRADPTTARLPDPATATPRQLADAFAALPAADRTALANRHPDLLGNLDGVPLDLRYRANHARTAGTRWVDAQVLAYDPSGRGRLAVVLGDLAHAASVAVVVPGSDVDLRRFANPVDPMRGPDGMARALADTAGPDLAVIAWLGYDTPEGVGVDAATGRLARAGATALSRFAAGLAATTPARQRYLCHSYGTVVCALAARDLPADDLVFVGSPGVRTDTATDLHTRARVWAARAPGDWTAWLPHLSVGDLGHGADPTAVSFGARPFSTAGAVRHQDYFRPGTESLRNLTRIAVGNPAAVTR
jgi:hypothetical protein